MALSLSLCVRFLRATFNLLITTQLPLSETYIRTNTQAVLTNAQLISSILGLFGAFGACANILSQLRKLKSHTDTLRSWSRLNMEAIKSPRTWRNSQTDVLSSRDTSRIDVIDVTDLKLSSRMTDRSTASSKAPRGAVSADDVLSSTEVVETTSSDSPFAQKGRSRVIFRPNVAFTDDPGSSSWVAELPGDVRDTTDDELLDTPAALTPRRAGPLLDHPSVRSGIAQDADDVATTSARSLNKRGRRDELKTLDV